MTALWAAFLEIFQVCLFWLTQFYGGQLGSAIVAFSLMARLALLPFGVKLALRSRSHARALAGLKPQLERIRERWKGRPERLASETLALYERHGVSPFPSSILRGSLLQSPVFIGMYHAVRGALGTKDGAQGFLWVANLARPDVGIAVLAAGIAGLAALSGASETQPTWTLALPVVLTGAMALALSSGFGLYLAAGGAVSTLQGLIVRRLDPRP